MPSSLEEKLCRINADMAKLLVMARKAIDGQTDFSVEEIRMIRAPLNEMEPIVAESANLRGAYPELGAHLDLYKSQLRELLITVERVRRVLLARRSEMSASQVHLEAVSQWAKALEQTR